MIDNQTIYEQKKETRKLLKKRISCLLSDKDFNKKAAEKATENFLKFIQDKQIDTFLLFYSLPTELDTVQLIQRLMNSHKKVYLPLIQTENDEMIFYKLNNSLSIESQVNVGSYDIHEPEKTEAFICDNAVTEKVCMLVPGIGFSKAGKRIGHGKGYYDKYLASVKDRIVLIGYCFDEQVIDDIPTEKNDIRIQYLCTPSCIFQCK